MDIHDIFKKLSRQDPELLNIEERKVLMDILSPDNIHCFLSKISVEDIVSKFEQFLCLDVKKMNDEELFNAVMNAISFDIDGSGNQISILFHRFITYKAGTKFYRIRSLKADDFAIPIKALKIEQDVWNAPVECCKIGRLNKEHESLLYTSPINPDICVEEMKIKDGDTFCLIEYEAVKDIKAIMIGIWEKSQDFSDEENLKMRMITDILMFLFTRDVGEGTDFLYRISERIAKDYYDLPRECQDCWLYPSVAAKLGYNACFRPEIAREVLSHKETRICSVARAKNQYDYTVKAVAKWNGKSFSFE